MEFKLPDIGEGLAEGEIVRWLVKAGERVAEDQPLVEVMTDKATVEIPSPVAGVVAEILAREGEVVPVGKGLVRIEEASADRSAKNTAASAVARPSTAPRTDPGSAAGGGLSPIAGPRPAVAEALGVTTRSRVRAAPATRKLAKELGVDIRLANGTGPHGRVTKDDVRALVAAAESASAPAEDASPARRVSAADRVERLPLRGLRKRIAEHLVEAKRRAAHYTYVEELDVTELVRLREEAKPLADKKGVKLSFLPFIIKALIPGLKEYPLLNSSLDEERGEIVLKHYYNIGIATATPDGLVVPVVKDADQRSILELAREIQRLSDAARAGKASQEDLKDGTFTITSAGSIGGLLATPILNTPEVAILGVNQIKRKPVVRGERIEIGDVLCLSLSLDHRVVDGAVGAEFMNRVKAFLENPRLLLLEAI